MAASNGNCFICGKTAGKTSIKNHVLKDHNSGDELCYLLKAEGAYNKDYWLLFTLAMDASLSAVDKFLRQIWCECCGHMSAFRIGGREFGKARKLSALSVGDTLLYEYDFGSTTEITVTVVDEISRAKQQEKVQLLARNVPPHKLCEQCGAPAAVVNALENELLCDKCAGDVKDEAALMPIVNSPRSGECGYTGEQDIWTFDPGKSFPQPQNTTRGVRKVPKREEEISAEVKWNKINAANQKKLLANVFCGKCGTTTIADYTIENWQSDIVLCGKCEKCGGNVSRVVECA